MCRSRTALSQTEDMITAWALGPHTTVTLRAERVRPAPAPPTNAGAQAGGNLSPERAPTPTSSHARMIVPTGGSAPDSEDPSQAGHMDGKTCTS